MSRYAFNRLMMLIIASLPARAAVAAPDFGPNVLVLDPSTPGIQQRIDDIFRHQRDEFGSGRCAILLKPGRYSMNVNVGYYMQILGLGASPDDVQVDGVVDSRPSLRNGNATTNFWRGVENFSVNPPEPDRVNVWAVSQGVDFRRMHVVGNLNLWEGGWSSGGFLADSRIDGNVTSGTQQQWLSRNAEWGRWRGGVWNMVFVGTSNPPNGAWPARPYTVIPRTPLAREKPFLFTDPAGIFFVKIPALRRDSQGISWSSGLTEGSALPISRFYIARADRDTAATIDAALDSGMNLILTPGIYLLESPLRITHPNTVVLGLGFPTLRPVRGTPAVTTDDIDGVEMGGIILEAGEAASSELMRIGAAGSSQQHSADPISLFDIFGRVGGATAGSADSILTINSSDVIGDNFWLWRADHGAGARWNTNRNRNGLIVNGNDVTIYGLAVEHTQEYQTLWNGDNGRVYFYQSEMPYDPPSESAWSHDGVIGYASYKVTNGVRSHHAYGLGIYCCFTRAPLVAGTAIEAPISPDIEFLDMITIRLSGLAGSGIAHVLNDRGGAVVVHHSKEQLTR